MNNKELIRKWLKEDRENKLGTTIEIIKEKKQIITHLFKLRRIMFVFERAYFRLLQLYRYFRDGYVSLNSPNSSLYFNT